VHVAPGEVLRHERGSHHPWESAGASSPHRILRASPFCLLFLLSSLVTCLQIRSLILWHSNLVMHKSRRAMAGPSWTGQNTRSTGG
jgi:hypothetical protein